MTDTPCATVVLVVDDEPMIRMFAADVIADAGFLSIEAADGAEAMTLLAAHPEVTILFTDINMPGPFDGLELARKVHSARPDVQLILTSGRERPSAAEIPDDGQFVAKPYHAAKLMQFIHAATTPDTGDGISEPPSS